MDVQKGRKYIRDMDIFWMRGKNKNEFIHQINFLAKKRNLWIKLNRKNVTKGLFIETRGMKTWKEIQTKNYISTILIIRSKSDENTKIGKICSLLQWLLWFGL